MYEGSLLVEALGASQKRASLLHTAFIITSREMCHNSKHFAVAVANLHVKPVLSLTSRGCLQVQT